MKKSEFQDILNITRNWRNALFVINLLFYSLSYFFISQLFETVRRFIGTQNLTLANITLLSFFVFRTDAGSIIFLALILAALIAIFCLFLKRNEFLLDLFLIFALFQSSTIMILSFIILSALCSFHYTL
jgi:hypothetical protein